jgi:hypothetical protein
LLGATDSFVRGLEGIPCAFFTRADFDSDVAVAQAELGDPEFADAFGDGPVSADTLAPGPNIVLRCAA